jgi:hypothetical protein
MRLAEIRVSASPAAFSANRRSPKQVILECAVGVDHESSRRSRKQKRRTPVDIALQLASVQTHSEDSIGDGGPMRTSKILSHRRRPVPRAELGPGLRREDKEESIALNHPNASKD